jgi:hypothetical protein
MTKEKILDLIGEFTWDFGNSFFIETAEGNFIWRDPDYNGDNSIRQTNQSAKEYFGKGFGRSKGKHYIKSYCGTDIVFVK